MIGLPQSGKCCMNFYLRYLIVVVLNDVAKILCISRMNGERYYLTVIFTLSYLEMV
jgi:hypothetical protein